MELKGTVSRTTRRLVRKLLHLFIVELRGILKRVAPAYYAANPDARRPCHTCAFNPSTDRWRGMEKTSFELMKAIRDGRTFHCHENIPWRKPMSTWTSADFAHFHAHSQPCAAYLAIKDDPKTADAFIVAMLRTNGRRPCQEAIDLAQSAIAGAGDVLR